jgi:DNA replication protein DnaC
MSAHEVRCPSTVEEMMEHLHLRTLAANYPALIEAAGKDNLSHEEFLRRVLSLESGAKFERQVSMRIAHASFPVIKTIDQFDFAHPTSIQKQKILYAMDLSFLAKADGYVFMGPTGVGKSHLSIAIGYKAASAGIRVRYTRAVDMINHLIASQADHSLHSAMHSYVAPSLLIIDEVGYLPFDKCGSDHFFNVISSRYEKGSVILTTNRAFKDWGKIFHDTTVASAIIDRLAHHSEVIKIEGASYRVKDKHMKKQLVIEE